MRRGCINGMVLQRGSRKAGLHCTYIWGWFHPVYIQAEAQSSIVSSQSPEREREEEEEEEEDNEGERQAVVEGEGAVQNWDQEFDQPAW